METKLAISVDDRRIIEPMQPAESRTTKLTPPDLPERFELRRELGRGAFGAVWATFDRERNELVALKTLLRRDATVLYRFKQEFRALAGIAQPNLIALHELFCVHDTWFFTMDLIRGQDFRAFVRGDELIDGDDSRPRSGPTTRSLVRQELSNPDGLGESGEGIARVASFDEARLRSGLLQLARGLDALHGAGKLHCDIKPSNVLVTGEGQLFILDFGLVSEVGSGEDYSGMGTPAYMSPEQLKGKGISAASDWYAVGIMLYEALAGKKPFVATTTTGLFQAKLGGAPPDVRTCSSGVPEDLASLTMKLLDADPAKRPTGEDILRLLGAAPHSSTSVRPPGLGGQQGAFFVGRKEPLAVLSAAYRNVLDGHPTAVRIAGPSGVGKSALVAQFLEQLRYESRRPVVLQGRCYEQEWLPYKALDSFVDALTRHLKTLPSSSVYAFIPPNIAALAQMFPVLHQLEDIYEACKTVEHIGDLRELRQLAFGALRQLLTKMGSRQPLVVYLDALQWGDVDSAHFLRDFFEPPHVAPILLIECFRSENQDTNEVLRILRNPTYYPNVRVEYRDVSVGPLTEGDSLALARLLAKDNLKVMPYVARVARESEGNPTFVRELIRYLDLGGVVASDGELHLDQVLSARISGLSEAEQKLLQCVAAAGVPTPVALIERLAELGDRFRAALLSLRSGHLVRAQGLRKTDKVEIANDRLGDLVLRPLDATARAEAHRNLALALEASSEVDSEALAHHWLKAGHPERACPHAVLAADRAASVLAFERAAGLYYSAVTLGSSEAESTHALELKLAETLTSAGHWKDAAEWRLRIAERLRGTEALRMRRHAAEQLVCSGHFDRGANLLYDVLHAHSIFTPSARAVTLLALGEARLELRLRGFKYIVCDEASVDPEVLARIDALAAAGSALSMTDNVRGAYFQTRALMAALDAGELTRLVRSLAIDACFTASGGQRSKAKTLNTIAETKKVAALLGTPFAEAMLESAIGFYHYFLGDWSPARKCLARAEQLFTEQCVGQHWNINTVRTILYRALVQLGDFQDLAQRVPTSYRAMEQVGDIFGTTNLRSGPLVWLGFAEGRVETVSANLDAVEKELPSSRYVIQHYFYHQGCALVDLYSGKPHRAQAFFEATWPALEASLLLRVSVVRITALELRGRLALAVALSKEEDRRSNLSKAQQAAKAMEGEKSGFTDGYAALLRAGIAHAHGDKDAAIKQLDVAMVAFDQAEMKLNAAATRFYRGRLLGSKDGAALIEGATQVLAKEGIRSPEAFATMLAPGIARC